VHVDQRGAWAAVAHPVHHLPQGGAGGRRQVVPCVPQVVKELSGKSASARVRPELIKKRSLVHVQAPAQPQDKGIPSSARRTQISLLADAPERPSAEDWQGWRPVLQSRFVT